MPPSLRSLPSPAVPRPRRPPWVDLVVAVTFLVLSALEVATSAGVRSPALHLALSGTAMAAIAWRRQYPVSVAVLGVVANVATNPQNEFTTLLALVLTCYTIGAETDPPRAYWGLAAVLGPYVGVMVFGDFVPSDLAAGMVFIVGPWVVGSTLRQRTTLAAAAVSEAERRAREQEVEAQQAAAAERIRIARELHDIVSHSISVITIQTQAVRRRLGAEQAEEARDLALVEATAREAMAEMRRLFGVLRSEGDPASLNPQPGLSELPRLVESVGTGGPRVRLVQQGEPVALPPGLDLAAYRIAQEGLTNALRHAEATEVTLTVCHEADALGIEVRDDGRGLAGPRGAPGHGLDGIRERVSLYGGSVALEDLPTGGARLVARLPLGGSRP